MNLPKILSITEARANIFDIAEKAQHPGTYYTLTENGRPKAVIMSAEEFESWKETLEVVQEFPDLKKDIKETQKAIKSGAYKNWVSLETLLLREGFIVAEKPKKKYGLSTSGKAKRGKRAQKVAK
jgi:antitoxin YefM